MWGNGGMLMSARRDGRSECAGPGQRTAAGTEDLPFMLQRGGESGAGRIGPAAKNRGGFLVSTITADVGKCSVCGLRRQLWLDRGAGVKLCEYCYGRGVREDAQEAGVV